MCIGTLIDRLARQYQDVTSREVFHLVNKLKESYVKIEGLRVFCDRYYSNLDLAAKLMEVHVIGTIIRN